MHVGWLVGSFIGRIIQWFTHFAAVSQKLKAQFS